MHYGTKLDLHHKIQKAGKKQNPSPKNDSPFKFNIKAENLKETHQPVKDVRQFSIYLSVANQDYI